MINTFFLYLPLRKRQTYSGFPSPDKTPEENLIFNNCPAATLVFGSFETELITAVGPFMSVPCVGEHQLR